jgi:hypothetical protein
MVIMLSMVSFVGCVRVPLLFASYVQPIFAYVIFFEKIYKISDSGLQKVAPVLGPTLVHRF